MGRSGLIAKHLGKFISGGRSIGPVILALALAGCATTTAPEVAVPGDVPSRFDGRRDGMPGDGPHGIDDLLDGVARSGTQVKGAVLICRQCQHMRLGQV